MAPNLIECVNQAILHALDGRYFEMPELNIPFLQEPSSMLSNRIVGVHTLPITATEIFFNGTYLLAIHKEVILIYKIHMKSKADALKISASLVKRIENHYLLFSRAVMKREARMLAYHILLALISERTPYYEACLEGIIVYLDLLELQRTTKFKKDSQTLFRFEYSDGTVRYYDAYLNIAEECSVGSTLIPTEENSSIARTNKKVIITNKKELYRFVIKAPYIRQVVNTNGMVLLLGKSSILFVVQ